MESEATEGSIRAIEETTEEVRQVYTLEEALDTLMMYAEGEGIDISSLSIHSIHGDDVDMEGKAGGWVLGAESGMDPYIFAFTGGKWTKYRWSEHFEYRAIDIKKLQPPADLYETNREAIMELMENAGADVTVLDIVNDRAIIAAVSGERFARLILDAYTGEVIVSE